MYELSIQDIPVTVVTAEDWEGYSTNSIRYSTDTRNVVSTCLSRAITVYSTSTMLLMCFRYRRTVPPLLLNTAYNSLLDCRLKLQ